MKTETEEQAEKRQVMKEGGHQDIGDVVMDLGKDTTGTKDLNLEISISFAELCSYVVELSVSEYWHPEVKKAKQYEIKDLLDYNTF